MRADRNSAEIRARWLLRALARGRRCEDRDEGGISGAGIEAVPYGVEIVGADIAMILDNSLGTPRWVRFPVRDRIEDEMVRISGLDAYQCNNSDHYYKISLVGLYEFIRQDLAGES